MDGRKGGADAANIMEFWTMEGYVVGFLIAISVVAVKNNPRLINDQA